MAPLLTLPCLRSMETSLQSLFRGRKRRPYLGAAQHAWNQLRSL